MHAEPRERTAFPRACSLFSRVLHASLAKENWKKRWFAFAPREQTLSYL